MAQRFSERLDFVMGVTGTTNSSLARALSFDASYICRIRNGKRGLPRSQPFAEPAAAYLASRVSDVRQERALEEEIGCPWPAGEQEAAKLLASWLLADAGGAPAVGQALAALSAQVTDGASPMMGGANLTVEGANPAMGGAKSVHPAHSAMPSAHVSFHYGNEGKREAVLAFLGQLAAEGKPRELLLHSDEDMSWLYEDDAFAREWTALLLRVIDVGCRIRVVHAISRNANEMWEAVGKWMPLYMTGAIEPYHYPRLRDGVYRRTLFVACGHSAIVAVSVGDAANDGLNMLVSDLDAVAAYEREFARYLALCRPLMDVAFPESPRELAEAVAAFAEGEGDLLATLADGKLVCAWSEGPALVASTGTPLVVFGIDERRMAAAVWGYLQGLSGSAVRRNASAHALLEDLARTSLSRSQPLSTSNENR